jgi:hypothetical protein
VYAVWKTNGLNAIFCASYNALIAFMYSKCSFTRLLIREPWYEFGYKNRIITEKIVLFC